MPFKRLITLSGLEQNGVLINYKPSTWPIKCHREHASPQSINFFRKVCIYIAVTRKSLENNVHPCF